MIKKLIIKNYALIESLEVDFEKGFTVISGETGAGKSIMIDAVSLLMGKRSDRGSLFDKDRKCIIESNLLMSENKKYLFSKHNLDFEGNTIIRREISPSGKSRSFVNDTPVSLSVLNEISSSSLEIYSQNQSIRLKSEDKQLELLDKIADTNNLLEKHQIIYRQFIKLSTEIENIKKGSQLSDSELEFLSFQIEELEKSNLREGEKKELEIKFKVLENASTIIENLSKSYHSLSEENGITSKVCEIESDLNKVSEISDKLSDLKERVSSVRIELQDLESDMHSVSEYVDSDPENLSKVSNRLDLLNSLLVKHKKVSISELLVLLNELNLKVQSSSNYDKLIQIKEEELLLKRKELILSSEKLTKKRKSVCNKFKSDIEFHLKKLGIQSPVFIVEISEREEFNSTGNDIVKFLFSANKGSSASEINKVASGGELSRLMLCFSYLVSEFDNLSCLIFDEIDTGISGEIADLMSGMMKEMSKNRQVISITHLPQIASKADVHFKVYKKEKNNRTTSETRKLNKEGRIEEIAKMLSGKKITETSISNAKELLSQ